jgi:hypothetical protein
MSATFSIDQKTGIAYAHIPLSSQRASTFHSDHITLNKVATVAETDFIEQKAYLRFHFAFMPKRDDDEEQKWDALFAQPHVQAGLSRLAEEAERQFALGETEEGGFGVE